MAYRFYNPNPYNLTNGDCVTRAVSRLMNTDWDSAYLDLATQAFIMKSRPDANSVWGAFLYQNGYNKYIIPDTCPMCYTIREFAHDHPYGRYAVATGTHVVAVIDGNYYDSWDSGDEVPTYYWKKEI